MTSGFDEMSLALFTTLAPAGAVAFIMLALARFAAHDHDEAVRIDRMVALPFAVCLVGFIASATHLGTPANALHVFGGIGRSPLSNEVLAAVAFLFFAGSYWMMAFKQNFPDKAAKPWLALASATAAVFIAFTSVAYSVSTVPTWNTVFTPANLLLSALHAGPLLGLLFLQVAKTSHRIGGFITLGVSTLALAAGTFTLALHQASLASLGNNEISAASLVPDYPSVIVAHLILGVVAIIGAALSLRPGLKNRTIIALRVTSCSLALLGVFITRIVFYQLHMTLGF